MAPFHTCLNTSLKGTKSPTQIVGKWASLYTCKSSYQDVTIVVSCPSKVAIRKHGEQTVNKYSCTLMYENYLLSIALFIFHTYIWSSYAGMALDECFNSCSCCDRHVKSLHGYFIYLNYHISASKKIKLKLTKKGAAFST